MFLPPGLSAPKTQLFNRIAERIVKAGGRRIVADYDELRELPDQYVPIVGASPELRPIIEGWRARGRQWIYWDRGYARRIYATWLPRGEYGGFYRWQRNAFQMRKIRNVPADRWKALKTEVKLWQTNGRHIVLAKPSPTYAKSHGCENWTEETVEALSRLTDRQLVIRGKETKRPLQADLEGAHALVTHGSIAAVEAVILGCPVFVHPDSAAALVGHTDLRMIEYPKYPERQPWLSSLAYSQYNERELVDGTLWRILA